ncbi:AraC family transcriptional regulator [Epilithonimonas tenax]|uniref:AraC family transcriptional regulator n=1 Tax=Epilithonimonas tenax TaxID=191577 RepID=UPI0004864CA6|nr:helix-turn-helix transcriptional regulator [Epilithonimonas tenax]
MNPIKVLDIHLFQKADQSGEFYCNTLQDHLKESHKHIERPHRHNFFLMMFVTKGTGFHDIDFNTYPLKDGSVYFMSPGQVHSWQLSDDVEGFIIFFSQSFFDFHYADLKLKAFPFFASVNFPRLLQLDAGYFSEMRTYFETIRNETVHHYLLKDHMLRNAVSNILILSSRLFLENEKELGFAVSSSYLHTFQAFEKLMEEQFLSQRSVSFYAALLTISGKHLNRICQSVVGLKASEVIAKRTVLEAQRMLVYLDDSLGDIAFKLGFEEYPYFTRFFKKHVGQSPSEFLKRHQINFNKS